LNRRFFGKTKLLTATDQDVILGYVVSRGAKKQRAHYIGGGGHFRVRWGIGFHEKKPAASIAKAETGADTFSFGGNHRVWGLRPSMNPPACF
jgi:hypothetical protein